jgi:hypothetical protein
LITVLLRGFNGGDSSSGQRRYCPGARSGKAASAPCSAATTRAAQKLRGSAWSVTAKTETESQIRWMEGFYPIYAVVQSAFTVNWLLITWIHMHEFLTDLATYEDFELRRLLWWPDAVQRRLRVQ